MTGEFSFAPGVGPVCQLGMSDVRQAEPDEWIDISCYVHEAELVRGRERFNDRFQPGTATITFTNEDGWADLVGDYAEVEQLKLRPGRQIRVGVRGPWGEFTADGVPPPVSTRWLWRGYIDQATPDYDPVAHDVVTVTCIDALGEVGMVQLLGGPYQGVNETVHARLNRVLDATHWWSGKRSLEAGTALMQGTDLKGSAADLLSAPADSAGGVVFGDLNGNIVYRDIDWELYDPDTPDDGSIGNCDPSIPPSPGSPPHTDPGQDPVYDPDPPPPTHPEVTKFCLGPSETGGRVIERGPAYIIYIKRGTDGHQHKYLQENGHTYDMGIWEPAGGCTTITHPRPGEPPTSHDCPLDDPDCDGGPEIPGCEIGVGLDCIPPVDEGFAVELLGYSDGHTSVATVTVPGITPGPGAFLICLINALCDNVTTGSLRPFPIVNGHLEGPAGVQWTELHSEIAGGNGAESYAAITRTDRHDPGTFDVVVDWSDTHHSRQHIVTVWKVTGESDGLLERMQADDYLRVFTWDRNTTPIPTLNPPGKGAWELTLANPAVDTPPYPNKTDIVIAQSLADSAAAPFGASFNEDDGPWWTPAFADEPAVMTAAATISDDFERANGPLGANWVVPDPLPDQAQFAVPVNIDAGAAVSEMSDPGSTTPSSGFVRHVTELPDGGQYVEVEIANAAPTEGAIELYVHMNDNVDSTCHALYMGFNPGVGFLTPGLWSYTAAGDETTDVSGTALTFPSTPTITLRLEVDADGTARYLVNGTLEHTATLPVVAGTFAGMAPTWSATPALRVNRFEAGSSGGIVRQCSWVAGYRPDITGYPATVTVPTVKWDEVNYGTDAFLSSQSVLVVSPLLPDSFGWRTLATYAHALDPGLVVPTIPPGSHTSTVRYQRNSMLVVFVAGFTGPDVTAGLTVTSDSGLTFTRSHTRPPDGFGHGQGVIFTAKTPELALAPDDPAGITVAWTATLDGVAYAVYEVTNGGTVRSAGSGTMGTHDAATDPVTGSTSIGLSLAPQTSSVVLGFAGVLADPAAEGDRVNPGAGWVEEVEYVPSEWAYLEVQSRTSSAGVFVQWADVNTSTIALASDAVLLAVEITPGPDYVDWETTGPLTIGGSIDAFDGPIYSASEEDADGNIIWQFNPGDYV